MKSLLLTLACLFLFAAASFAQEGQVYSENSVPHRSSADGRTVASRRSIHSQTLTPNPQTRVERKRFVTPTSYVAASNSPDEYRQPAPRVKERAQVTMTVYDGYVQAEVPRLTENKPLAIFAGKHLKGFSTGDTLVDSYIVESSRRYNIDPLLIYAQMGQESSFKPRAISHKGARGLMQLMPMTARRLGVTDIYDLKQNIEGGVKYMRILLNMFSGDVKLALAGYNAGEGAVIKYGYQIPPYNETRDYVKRISARYNSLSGPSVQASR